MASSSYAARVTARIPGVLAQHPGWSPTEARRFLRGHGVPGQGVTPEHGKLTRTVARGTVQSSSGSVSIEPTYRDSRVISQVNHAAASGGRVQINTHTKGGGWQKLGSQNRGYSASYVAQKIADHGGDVRAAVAELLESGGNHYDLRGYGSAGLYSGAVDAWQVVAYE